MCYCFFFSVSLLILIFFADEYFVVEIQYTLYKWIQFSICFFKNFHSNTTYRFLVLFVIFTIDRKCISKEKSTEILTIILLLYFDEQFLKFQSHRRSKSKGLKLSNNVISLSFTKFQSYFRFNFRVFWSSYTLNYNQQMESYFPQICQTEKKLKTQRTKIS